MLRSQVKVAEGDGYTVEWVLGWRIAHTASEDLIGSGFVILTNGDNGWELLKRLAPEVSPIVHSPIA